MTLVRTSDVASQAQASAVATLLDHSAVESVLPEFLGGVLVGLEELGVALTPEQTAVLERHFAPSALRPIMEQALLAQDENNLLVAVADLVSGGAIGQADSIAEASAPTTSLEHYAAQLQTNRPPDGRIQLVAQIASAQAAGDFYVLLGGRMSEAAHVIARTVSSSAPPFEPTSEEEWTSRAEQNFLGALVSFLWRYQNVSDDLLERTLADWSSEPGAWYVRGYSLALGESVLVAADNVAAELRSR